MAEEILQKVKDILSSEVGDVVAESTVRVNCQKIGIKPEELSRDKLDVFVEEIKVSLLLFLDDKQTEEIIDKIKSI